MRRKALSMTTIIDDRKALLAIIDRIESATFDAVILGICKEAKSLYGREPVAT